MGHMTLGIHACKGLHVFGCMYYLQNYYAHGNKFLLLHAIKMKIPLAVVEKSVTFDIVDDGKDTRKVLGF